jgi:uncharacterized protein DUF1569
MTINTGSVKGRRTIRFEGLDDLQREAEFVASRPGKTLGNWSVAQIVDHLGKAIDASYNGPPVSAPWHIRLILAPLIRPGMLSKGMPAGFSLPGRMSHFLPDASPEMESSLQNLRNWLHRLKTEAPLLKHPAFGSLSHDDWIRLHLRHGELHLSFIIPGNP